MTTGRINQVSLSYFSFRFVCAFCLLPSAKTSPQSRSCFFFLSAPSLSLSLPSFLSLERKKKQRAERAESEREKKREADHEEKEFQRCFVFLLLDECKKRVFVVCFLLLPFASFLLLERAQKERDLLKKTSKKKSKKASFFASPKSQRVEILFVCLFVCRFQHTNSVSKKSF